MKGDGAVTAESNTNKDDKQKKKQLQEEKVPLYKLFTFADGLDKFLMFVGTIGAIGNGLTQPIMTLILTQAINSMGNSDRYHVVHDVSKICLKFVYLSAYAGVVCFLQVACWMTTGERQSARIRGLYLKAILKQDIGYFDTETSTGEVIGRMSGDTVLLQDAMGDKLAKFIQLTSTFIGGFVISFVKGWQLTLILLSSLPALVIAGGIMALILSKMSSRAQKSYAQAGNVVEQTVGAIRTVVSFTGEAAAIKNYDIKLGAAYVSSVQQGLASGLGAGAMVFIIFATYALAIWYGSRLIITKGYDGGRVIYVIMTMMTGGMALGQTSPSLNAFAQGQAAAFKMFETIKRQPKIDASNNDGMVLDDIKGNIELKDVYFKYPARPDVQIFSGFSLFIPGGTTVALVGQSGSGKSTVISLVERFYDPEAGEVLIDGVNLKKMKLSWIRQKIGIVSQEPNLFATSIKENIKYGKEDATDDEIRSALVLANAAKFIDKLPKGLDTMVGEHGTQMSGGQKQRIAIARAILKNPRILLLDEATSALDAESERIVQEALDRIMTNRTTVVVAHRLTTIKNADTIAVVHQGKIVEQGPHDELTKDENGAYSQLIKLQQGAQQNQDHQVPEDTTSNLPTSLDKNISKRSKSSRRRPSVTRSISRGSSIGSQSFTMHYGIPVLTTNINQEDDKEEIIEADKDDIESNEKRPKVSIRRLAYLNKPELPFLFLGAFSASVHGCIYPIFGLLLSTAIKIFYEPAPQLRKDSKFWALIYLALAGVSFLAFPCQNFFFGIAGSRLIRRIRFLTFEKVVHQEISWFDDPINSSGAIGARLSTDASNIRSLVGDQLALLMQNLATIVAGLVVAFTANWMLALIMVAVSPFMFIQGYLEAKFTKGFGGNAELMYEEASQVANDAVGSIRTVASFCAEKKVMDLYAQKCEAPVKQGIRLGIMSGTGFGSSFLALYCVNAFCFYIGAMLIRHDKATFPEVFKVFFALVISAVGLSQSSGAAADSNKARSSTASIFDILDRKPKIDSRSDEGITLTSVKGDIELEHVSFKYPTRPDMQIFRDLSLTIPSGKTVALVGESGSGKSTVICLIERFYDPDAGRVLLDGVELPTLKLSWLRQQMGLVSQEPVLFNISIKENIAYGKQGPATDDEIIRAAKSANAHNFISSLTHGYDTSVGERGVQLSGGQKQRIAIARAILKNPQILLLDEATSALDAESERVVQDALDKVMVNRTTVVVAHRLGTIKNADVIAVVKNGVVAEKGNHEELLKIQDGAYASLVALHSGAST